MTRRQPLAVRAAGVVAIFAAIAANVVLSASCTFHGPPGVPSAPAPNELFEGCFEGQAVIPDSGGSVVLALEPEPGPDPNDPLDFALRGCVELQVSGLDEVLPVTGLVFEDEEERAAFSGMSNSGRRVGFEAVRSPAGDLAAESLALIGTSPLFEVEETTPCSTTVDELCAAALAGAAAPGSGSAAATSDVSGLGTAAAASGVPVDDRFFGTFCQTAPRTFCKDVDWAPDPCAEVDSMAVHLDHVLTSRGSKLVGTGAFRLDDVRAPLTVAGAVTARGRARFTAVVPGLGREGGEARISADGEVLVVDALGRSLTLTKNACGNRAPEVSLNLVGGPEFPFRRAITMGAAIDDEDDAFPPDRIQFVSDRQGPIAGHRANGNRTITTTRLLPGRHRVSVRVIDSGGLAATDAVDLTVTNRPPRASIRQPADGAEVPATVPVLLRGAADDPEEGALPPGRLRWEVERVAGGGFALLASGDRAEVTFDPPGGPVRVRLRATDSAGAERVAEHHLTVRPFTGNAPPQVAIERPVLPPGRDFALVAVAGEPIWWEATASDLEDAPDDLDLRWTFAALDGGGRPDPAPTVPNPPPVTGERVAEVTFGNIGNVAYRGTFSATDTAGATASGSVDIFVLAAPVD